MRNELNIVKVLRKLNLLEKLASKNYGKAEWQDMLFTEGKIYFTRVFSDDSESEDLSVESLQRSNSILAVDTN